MTFEKECGEHMRSRNLAGLDLSLAALPRAASALESISLHQSLHLRLPKKIGTPGMVL